MAPASKYPITLSAVAASILAAIWFATKSNADESLAGSCSQTDADFGASGDERQWLVVVRHGDRHDYADKEAWKRLVAATGGRERDPPLSALGHRQARALGRAAGAALARRGGPVHIRSSPYVRCLQTIAPLADELDASVHVDHGLAEIRHDKAHVAPFEERVGYFPRLVDGAAPPASEESWPLGYMERIVAYGAKVQKELDAALEKHARSTFVFTSHAASVALVAVLLGRELVSELKFAPCGAYVLARDSAAEPWRVLRAGDSNAPYVLENSTTTFPWGYRPQYLEAWSEYHGGKRFPTS